MSLCPSCRGASDAWLDYRLPAERPRMAASANYDSSVRGAADARKARTAEWRRTIRTQQQIIRDACVREHITKGDS